MGVSDLEGLEEIAQQTAFSVSERTRHGKFGWAISPNIERSSVAREKIAAAPSDVTPAPPSTVSRRSTANLGRTITDYRTLVETCRARADDLELSRLEIDRIGGLPAGYAGKLLGKAAVDNGKFPRKKSSKKMWPVALEAMLGVLGLKILLIEDDAATARTLALRTPVDRANQRFGNVCRISATLPKALAGPPSLSIVGGRQKRGGKYG